MNTLDLLIIMNRRPSQLSRIVHRMHHLLYAPDVTSVNRRDLSSAAQCEVQLELDLLPLRCESAFSGKVAVARRGMKRKIRVERAATLPIGG